MYYNCQYIPACIDMYGVGITYILNHKTSTKKIPQYIPQYMLNTEETYWYVLQMPMHTNISSTYQHWYVLRWYLVCMK